MHKIGISLTVEQFEKLLHQLFHALVHQFSFRWQHLFLLIFHGHVQHLRSFP